MDILIPVFLGLTGLLIFITARDNKKLRIFSAVVIIISAAGIMVSRLIIDSYNSTEILASFFSGKSLSPASIGSAELLPDKQEPANPVEWKLLNSDEAEIKEKSNSFSIKPRSECLWQKSGEGLMIYRNIEGDFYFSSLVRTRKSSDTLKYPDHDWQFGGIVIRNPLRDTIRNNIMIAVGYRDSLFEIRVNSTTNGVSAVSAIEWHSGDAELMVQRESGVFGVYIRRYGIMTDWKRIQTIYRPDFPPAVQAGLAAYSYSNGSDKPDLVVYFDSVKLWRDNE